MVHILYIEDEKDIGKCVTQNLKEKGYQVTWMRSGEGICLYNKKTHVRSYFHFTP
jgi:DNA-binding response OmpR family regulator